MEIFKTTEINDYKNTVNCLEQKTTCVYDTKKTNIRNTMYINLGRFLLLNLYINLSSFSQFTEVKTRLY